MKESGINRAGWGSFPHVLLSEFLIMDPILADLQKTALRVLIIYGEMSIQSLVYELQKDHPNYVAHKEWLMEDLLDIKKNLRTFYSLNIDENFTKVELVYHMHSDNTHKADSEKIINANLVRKEQEENKILSEAYKSTSYYGEEIFGTSELKYYRSRIRKRDERKEKCDTSPKET